MSDFIVNILRYIFFDGFILRTVLIMTLTGSLLSLVLFFLKPLLRERLPKATQYYLWLVVVAALIVPISLFIFVPENNTLLIPTAPIQNMVNQVVITAEEEHDYNVHKITSEKLEEDLQDNKWISFSTSEKALMTSYLVLAYPFGLFIVLFYYIINYFIFSRLHRRHNAEAQSDELTMISKLCVGKRTPQLYRNPLAATPMLIGVFRPEIILPDCDYTDNQLRSILLHELTHLRRKDVLVKWFSVLVTALHWFNPIVWLVRREVDRACELACDETVIRHFDAEGKQNYGETLLYVAADTKTPHVVLSTTMCEEKKALKERLGAIMKSKKHTRLAIIISAVLIIAVGGIAIALGAGSATINNENTAPIASIEVNYNNETLVASNADNLPIKKGEEDDNGNTPIVDESLREFASLRTPYVGNNSAVGSIINLLPPLGEPFTQKFFSIGDDYGTGKAPNTLTLYYDQNGETDDDFTITSQIPLILFAMIDNLEEVNLATRNAPSGNELDKSAYGIRYTYPRPEAADYIPDVGISWGEFQNDWENSFGKLYSQALTNNLHEWDNAEKLTLEDERPNTELPESSPVDELIISAIIEKNRGHYGGEGNFTAASAVTLKTVEHDGYITAYIMAYYSEYSNMGWLHQTAGSHIPVAITLDKTTLEVTEYWEAEDGSRYWTSIRKKFPEDTWDKIDTQLYVKGQAEKCLQQAQSYYDGVLSHAITQDWPGSRLRISGYGNAVLTYDPNYGDMYIAETLPVPQLENERVEGFAIISSENMDILNIRLTVSRPDPGSGTIEGPHIIINYSLKYDSVDELICEPFVNSTGEQFDFALTEENALATARMLSEAIQLCHGYVMYN